MITVALASVIVVGMLVIAGGIVGFITTTRTWTALLTVLLGVIICGTGITIGVRYENREVRDRCVELGEAARPMPGNTHVCVTRDGRVVW